MSSPHTKKKQTDQRKRKSFGNDKKSFGNKKHKDGGSKNQSSAPLKNWEKNQEFRIKLNKLYSDLQKKKLKPEERKVYVEEIWELLKGKVTDVASRHDNSRAIQSLFHYADDEIKDSIISELSDKMVALSKGNYSSFLVINLLKYGNTKQRVKILKEFKNHFLKLATHNVGARVVDCVIRTCNSEAAEKSLRKRLMEEFYGQEYLLLAGSSMNTSKSEEQTLEEKLSDLSEKQRKTITSNLESFVKRVADKGLLRYAYAQQTLLQYLQISNDEQKTHIIPFVRDACIAMASSEDGVESMVICISHADAKERKKFLKLFKGHVLNMAGHEFAYRMLLVALNVVDDTVLLYKSIIQELFADKDALAALVLDQNGVGRKVLLHLLSPGSKWYFTQSDIKLVEQQPATSKKPKDQRRKELLDRMKDEVCEFVAENVSKFALQKQASQFVAEVFAEYQSPKITEAMMEMMESYDEELPLMEHPIAHLLFKRCILSEKENVQDEAPFAQALVKKLEGDMVELASKNRPAFVFLALLEQPLVKDIVVEELDAHVDELTSDMVGVQKLIEQLPSGKKKSSKTPKKSKRKAVKSTPAKKTDPSPRRLRSTKKPKK